MLALADYVQAALMLLTTISVALDSRLHLFEGLESLLGLFKLNKKWVCTSRIQAIHLQPWAEPREAREREGARGHGGGALARRVGGEKNFLFRVERRC